MSKMPKSLTTVTRFSKLLALCLIVAFVFSAFYAGVLFDQKYNPVLSQITPTPTPIISTQTECQQDSDCILTNVDTQNSCCPNVRCLNNADNTTVAVNEKWLESQKASVCGQHIMCPMIMVVCTREIAQENAQYRAKCIRAVCTKVKINP